MTHTNSVSSGYLKGVTGICLVISMLIFVEFSNAQSCPNGSLINSSGFGVSATGGASGAANATGSILPSGSTLNGSNSAVSSTSVALIIDLGVWVAQGSTFTLSWSRSSGTPSGTVQYSNDNSTYTTLGTLSGAASSASIYRTFTVPSGGFRHIRITATSGVFFIDGVGYTHSCYYAAQPANDTRVVLSPGTAKGNISSNDLNYDNDALTYSLLSGVSNGTLGFNSSGAYTYTPNSGFEGVDIFKYTVSDPGPDGNAATSGDNSLDTATVIFRTLFNCDSATFYVPIPENEALDFLKDIAPTSGTNSDPTVVYIGLSVATDAIIVYDHWEDGFESNILAPTQSTTQIWGDGDLTNGVAPGFATDILEAGKAIILNNSLSSGHSGSTSYNPNASGSDATLQATIDYDGKDKIFIGGIGAMTKLMWGSIGTPSVCGGAVPSVKNWGTSYRLPVGINTPNSGNAFQIASLSIMASQSGTTVDIDRDANGSVDISVTLNEGETYYLDSRVGGSAVTVNQGATITANKPIMVNLLTGQYNSSPYQSRTFALIPNSQVSTCYYMPAVPQETMRVFLYNPNGSSITVTRTTAGGATSNITVAANSSNYNDVNSSGLGYRYCSSSNFLMLSTVDYNSGTSDWGFTPVPSSNLTSKVLVGFGDGEDPLGGTLGTNNYEQALITADCNTYLYVDLDGDMVPDKVSFNNDVDVTDNAVSIGGVNYNETTSDQGIYLQAYQTVTIGSSSGSLNGAMFWTKTTSNNGGSEGCNIALVWGQNGGPSTTPNIDAGYTVPNISTNIINVVTKSSDSVIVDLSADSITLDYSGAVAPYKVFWFNESTYSYSVFTTNSTSFKIYDAEPGNYLIKLKDANCRNFTQKVRIHEIPSARVNGTIYHDANGSSNGLIDGAPLNTLEGAQLYVYLVNGNGLVFDSARVSSNGTFSLIGRQSWNYSLRLSTTPVTFGVTAPSLNLPPHWVNAAEQFGTSNGQGTGIESGTPNGILPMGIGSGAINGAHFAVEKRTVVHDKTYNLTIDSVLNTNSGNTNFPYRLRLHNSSGTSDTTVNSGISSIMPGNPSGIDGEDGRFNGSTGSQAKFVLTQLPDSSSNGVLVYNNIILADNPLVASPAYTLWNPGNSRYEISSFDPSLFSMYLKAVQQTYSEFQYTYADQANITGTPATYRINFLTPLPFEILFTGELKGLSGYLKWTNYQTNSIQSFRLVRSDPDGFSSRVLANIANDGSPQITFKDDLSILPAGPYTYTLYSIDLSGKIQSHGSVTLELGSSTKTSVSAFPNPGQGSIVSIELLGYSEHSVKSVDLYSADGRLIFRTSMRGNRAELSLENLNTGVYTLRVWDGKHNSSCKLMVER